MICLAGSNQSLVAELAANATTGLDCEVYYHDELTKRSSFQPSVISTTTEAAILPGAIDGKERRVVDCINIVNRDSSAATISVYHKVDTTRYLVRKITMASGAHAVRNRDGFWQVMDLNGQILTAMDTAVLAGYLPKVNPTNSSEIIDWNGAGGLLRTHGDGSSNDL